MLRLEVWLKQEGACFASTKPCIQTPVPQQRRKVYCLCVPLPVVLAAFSWVLLWRPAHWSSLMQSHRKRGNALGGSSNSSGSSDHRCITTENYTRWGTREDGTQKILASPWKNLLKCSERCQSGVWSWKPPQAHTQMVERNSDGPQM
jgi:hypothetical protein